MITIYTLYVVRTSEDLWGSADSTKMFSFGDLVEIKHKTAALCPMAWGSRIA